MVSISRDIRGVTCIYTPAVSRGNGPNGQIIEFTSKPDFGPSVPITVTFDKPLAHFATTVVGISYPKHTTKFYDENDQLLSIIDTVPPTFDGVGASDGSAEILYIAPTGKAIHKVELIPPSSDWVGYRHTHLSEQQAVVNNKGKLVITVDRSRVSSTITNQVIVTDASDQQVATFSPQAQNQLVVELDQGNYKIAPHVPVGTPGATLYLEDVTYKGNSFLIESGKIYFVDYVISSPASPAPPTTPGLPGGTTPTGSIPNPPPLPPTIDLSNIVVVDTIVIDRQYRKGSFVAIPEASFNISNISTTTDVQVSISGISGIIFQPSAFTLPPNKKQQIKINFDLPIIDVLPEGLSTINIVINLSNSTSITPINSTITLPPPAAPVPTTPVVPPTIVPPITIPTTPTIPVVPPPPPPVTILTPVNILPPILIQEPPPIPPPNVQPPPEPEQIPTVPEPPSTTITTPTGPVNIVYIEQGDVQTYLPHLNTDYQQ